jgi:hypothetical protein
VNLKSRIYIEFPQTNICPARIRQENYLCFCTNSVGNKKFYGKLIVYFPWYDMNASNNSSIVVCVIVVAVKILSSCCLARIGWYRHTDWLEGITPCEGGVEYLHHDPASRRRQRNGKSQIWHSKIWLRVPWDSDPRNTALARASSIYVQETDPSSRQRRGPTKTRP